MNNKEAHKAAKKMLRRAQELGLSATDGKELSVDTMVELLAAASGHRNRHAWLDEQDKLEAPALKQECPKESGSDYELVSGRGVWLTMGAFSVHPYLTDEGVVVDVYALKSEDMESLSSTYAFTSEALGAFCEQHEIAVATLDDWATSKGIPDLAALEPPELTARLKEFSKSLLHPA